MNYIVGILLILLAILAKYNPKIIVGYSSLSEEKRKKFSFSTVILGCCITAFIAPVAAFNMRFAGNEIFANWAFIIVVPVGIGITIWIIKRNLNRD